MNIDQQWAARQPRATRRTRDHARRTPNLGGGAGGGRDAYFDVEFGKTLGRLIATLRALVPLPSSLEGRLTRALLLRNWLARAYFWDRSIDGMSVAGRADMIEELYEASEFLRSVDAELTAVSEAWLIQHGLSPELVEAELAAIRREAAARDGEDGTLEPEQRADR